jgi:hypothetical protein
MKQQKLSLPGAVVQKKRHHFVPKAYLKAFCDAEGKLRVYRKDNPSKSWHRSPESTGFRDYYYSQPKPDGDTDNNALEDAFCSIESSWPGIVERMQRREYVNDVLKDIFAFIALQRVRVPASRDATEAKLAVLVKSTLTDMANTGQLPTLPPGLENVVSELVFPIDPHMSIHGMVEDMADVASIYNKVGLCVVHNSTSLPFLTSDNPVIWFDPSVPEEFQNPYEISEFGPVMLLFPVSPTMLIIGASSNQAEFAVNGLMYGDAESESWVTRINEQICRFGYETVFAQKEGQEALVRAYADKSPVPAVTQFSVNSAVVPPGGMVFGKREKKPEW